MILHRLPQSITRPTAEDSFGLAAIEALECNCASVIPQWHMKIFHPPQAVSDAPGLNRVLIRLVDGNLRHDQFAVPLFGILKEYLEISLFWKALG
jgi:hypothetical protein